MYASAHLVCLIRLTIITSSNPATYWSLTQKCVSCTTPATFCVVLFGFVDTNLTSGAMVPLVSIPYKNEYQVARIGYSFDTQVEAGKAKMWEAFLPEEPIPVLPNKTLDISTIDTRLEPLLHNKVISYANNQVPFINPFRSMPEESSIVKPKITQS